jgi:Flp pilus assembly pilin Flp
MRHFRRFVRRVDAATAVEYAVMLALVLMVIFGAVTLFGQKANQVWNNNSTSLQSVNFGS